MAEDVAETKKEEQNPNPIQLENENWVTTVEKHAAAYEGDAEKVKETRSRGGGPVSEQLKTPEELKAPEEKKTDQPSAG
jgi:hypothetical protein